MIKYLRDSVLRFCLMHLSSRICVHLLLIILSKEEKTIMFEALEMIQTQRNFKRVLKI